MLVLSEVLNNGSGFTLLSVAVLFINEVVSGRLSDKRALAPVRRAWRTPCQIRPGNRVVTSWISHVLPSGSLKEQNDP